MIYIYTHIIYICIYIHIHIEGERERARNLHPGPDALKEIKLSCKLSTSDIPGPYKTFLLRFPIMISLYKSKRRDVIWG